MTKQLIEIKMPKCALFFTQQELQQLLARDPALCKNSEIISPFSEGCSSCWPVTPACGRWP